MALLTDDEDISSIAMYMEAGGNGDYYLSLIDAATGKKMTLRVATSGGNAPTDVKLAVAKLFRAMEKCGLNEHPANEILKKNSLKCPCCKQDLHFEVWGSMRVITNGFYNSRCAGCKKDFKVIPD